jgi:uncharacterized protein YukE
MIEEKSGHVIVPSSPSDRQKMRIMIEEMTHAMARIDSERDHKKEIADKIHEEFNIPKKTINKLAGAVYKHNYSDIQAENEDFEILYETLIESNTGGSDIEKAAQELIGDE